MLNRKNLMDRMDKVLEQAEKVTIEKELIDKFVKRTKYHIGLVNKYGAKIGREFPDHDNSKLNELKDGYCFIAKPREELSKVEGEILDLSTLIHITNSPHHPEYWTDTELSGFTRKNFTPNGIIDATQMPREFLEELCADWCACSYEFKTNTPFEWFDKVNGKRWKFSYEQQSFILDTLNKMWDGFDEF